MSGFLGLVVSVLVVIFTKPVVPAIFKHAGLDSGSAPNDASADVWRALRASGPEKAASWLGVLERLRGVTAIWTRTPVLLVGWFAFKVASKWQIWSSVVRLPESIEGVPEVSYMKLRRQWGANLLLRFLIGTLTNVLLGVLGGIAGQLVAQQIHKLSLY